MKIKMLWLPSKNRQNKAFSLHTQPEQPRSAPSAEFCSIARVRRVSARALPRMLACLLTLALGLVSVVPVQAQRTSQALNQLQTKINQQIANDASLEGAEIIASVNGNRQITLNGSVEDETQWQRAESLTVNTPGVRTVVNNLIITGPPNMGANTTAPASAGAYTGTGAYTGPTQAEPEGAYTQPEPSNSYAQEAPSSTPNAASAVAIGKGQIPPPPPADAVNNSAGATNGNTNPDQVQNGQEPLNSYAGNGSPNQGYRSDYQSGNGYASNAPQTSGPVIVPPDSLMQVRLVETLDSKHLSVGESFDATQANDVFVGNVLAIPRGAQITGEVVALKKSGALGGHTLLALRITGLTLGGQYYPLSSTVWANEGPNKAGYTASNTVTVGALGAVIGAIAGGGVGAAAGAMAGAAGGLGVSAATSGSRIVLPSESLLVFRLTQPVTVQPVSAYMAQRLGADSPQLQRRTINIQQYPQPSYGYPPPYYYGPAMSMGWGW